MPIKIDIDMYTSTTFTPFSMSMPDGRLVTFGRPQVMGILNVTPDSFYGGSRSFDSSAIEQRVSTMLAEGVDIIDIGGYSSWKACNGYCVVYRRFSICGGASDARRIVGG